MLTQKVQLVLLILGCWLPCSEAAAVAGPVYTMDEKPSCISAGYLEVPRGQTVILQGPSRDNSVAKELNCRLMFQAQTEGDTLRMTLDSASIFEDCDVSLELSMENSNADRVIRGCKSVPGTAPILSAVNGKASVWLARKAYDDNGYWFQVKITALRTVMQGTQDTASTGDIGKIVGITVGIIVFLVILIVVCICCYKRRNVNEKPQENKNGKYNDKVDNSLSPYVGHGYENNMAKLGYEDSFHQSPGFDRKLLGSDQKSKSALERFGNTSAPKKSDAVDAAPQRDRHQNLGFNRNEINFGQDVGRNVSKQRFADERLERASDHSSLTDLSSLPATSKPVSTQKSIQDSRSSPKPSGLRRPRENKSDSNPYQPSASSEFDRYKDGKDEDRSFKTSKNLSSDKNDAGWEKSPRKLDEKRRYNDYEEYENEERIRDRGPKADKKLRNYHSQDDDDSDQMEDARKNRKRSESSNKHDVSWEKSQRKPDEKRRHNEYDDEDKKREKGLKAGKKSRNYHSQEDDDSEQMEEIPKKKSERDGRSHSREDVREHEGRFKKSASGRKPKGKNPKMGRSRSTGNALDDLYSDDGKIQPKKSSSVRSLSLMDDDDTELDSNYMPFKRSGSKTSLYASRSSLYGRRRKNSMGETMSMSSYALSSYVHDDLDSRVGDFDSSLFTQKEKERLFKSTGDLNVSTAIIVRECATQTGSSKEVSVYGKRTVPQRKHGKRYNRGTQTTRERRDSGASEKSGRSERSGKSMRSNRNLRSKSRSKESLSRRHRSRSRDLSDDEASERSRRRHSERKYTDDSDSEEDRHHSRSKSNQRDKYTSERDGKSSRNKSKERSHSRQRHRDHSESEDEQSQYSSKSYETNKTEQNSQLNLAPYSGVPAPHVHQYGQQIPQFLPTGYPMVIQQPTTAFVSTDQNGMPVIIPVTSLTELAIQQKPALPVKPNASKWDQLVNITDDMKKRRHRMGESLETESVMSSVWSQPQVRHAELPYTKTQKVQGTDRIYGSHYGAAYDAGPPDSEYTVGYSRNYSATDSSV